jgi:F-type H+-transporting ATPase subunit b
MACALVFPLFAAANERPAGEGGVAHGAPKAGAEATHGPEGDAETHAARTILGVPEWVWKIVNLALFWGLLGYLLAGPVRRGLAARGDRIRQEIGDSRERRTKADEFAAQVDDRLKKLEMEVASILERARQDGERQKGEMIASAEVEAQKIIAGARKEVEARVKLARKELTEYAGDLAADRARRMLEESLSEADRHRLFDESVEQIGKVRS